MRRTVLLVALAVAGALVAGPATTLAKEKSKVKVPLARTGSDDDAAGSSQFRSTSGGSRFQVKVKNSAPGQSLTLKVGGLARATQTSSSGGSATFKFATGAVSGSTQSLDFDPRGEEIEIEDGSGAILTSTGVSLSATSIDESTSLQSTGVQPLASGKARLRSRGGKTQFKVEIEDVTAGAYDLVVDGVLRGTFNVSDVEAELEFANPNDDPGKQLLDFDPYGKLVQVMQGSSVILSGTMLASSPGVSSCTPSETETALSNVGPDPDASGDIKTRIKEDCRRSFSVEAEDVPIGDYDLVVAGVVRGTIHVALTPEGKIEGEIEFSSDPDDVDELPLDFDPVGATVEVVQAGTVYLSGTATSGGPSGTCDVVDVEPDMVSSGADGNANGKARFRQDTDCDRDFRVEIEKVAVGDYQLSVGGILRGTITVALVSGDEVGELEFETEPTPGKLLLDFDPRGQLVEVSQGGILYLSVTIPN